MKTQKKILTGIMVMVFSLCFSQKGKIRRASSDYDKFAYIKTSEILLEVAINGYESIDLFQKLGNSYYFNSNFADASKWYKKLVEMDQTIDAEYYFRYSQCLRSLENYDEADVWVQKFYEMQPTDSRGKAFMSRTDYLARIEKSSNYEHEVVNLNINSAVSDFGTTQYKDLLVFASSRGGGKVYKWNEQPFLDLYTAKKQSTGIYTDVSILDEKINTKYHESNAAFTPDNKYVFFTRNNYYKGKFKKDDKGINRLKLFRATLSADGNWEAIVPVHFNSDDYSVAHPSINASGTKLYFASDMPGTVGMSDIYVVDIKADGTLGVPENIGSAINTEGQESFPFINVNGDLFFSSNAYPGLGGLDIYVVRDFELKRASQITHFSVENIGKPINSPRDDFGYYENLNTKEGFFTSNREGGKGDDDIYSFNIPDCSQLVKGVIKDENTNELLAGARVTLYNSKAEVLDSKIVGDDAYYSFTIDCDMEYLVRGEKETYISDEKRFITTNKSQELYVELFLSKNEQEIEPCTDLAKVLHIPIIYFDFDKYDIRYDAEIELQKILAVLKQFPTMSIDIRSHTDCRGSFKYNETLSENRAQATRQYLINKGIEANRLTAKGYGESKLVNDCGCEPTNKSSCSEAEHQKNRRSEFIVTSFKGQKCN
jgi:outer membrane protein OmpA-like peptidoglycan-associated protein/Tol biopolymer transport system component